VLVRMGANAFIMPSASSASGVATVASTQRLLSVCIETVDVLLSAFPNLGVVEKRIPCSHCFAQRDALLEPFLFALADCVHAVESTAAFVYDSASALPHSRNSPCSFELIHCMCRYCRGIPSRPVRIDFLAPDLSFRELPMITNLRIERELGSGGFGVVWKATTADVCDAIRSFACSFVRRNAFSSLLSGGRRAGAQNRVVAVKELRMSAAVDAQEKVEKFQEFQQEVQAPLLLLSIAFSLAFCCGAAADGVNASRCTS
jgi:hypothetical protein